MSGIAGVIDLRGGLVQGSTDLNQLERITQRLRHRGPDGIAYWSAGPVGLAHAALHTTPEAALERQPHADAQGQCRIVFDGRLDNRATLRRELEAAGQRLREDTDAELALASYLAWGEASAAHLYGDFALAIWDGRRRQLYCARDIIGLRPFYYALTARYFLFASEPGAILESPEVTLEPDEAAVAAHISCNFQSNEDTLFRDIRRLPPAHALLLTAQEVRIIRYWSPDPNRTIRYSNDAEYAEHFLELFREVVRDRLRSNGPIGALLSGGLDSSSVVRVALDLMQQRGQSGADLHSFAMVFPGEICDETPYLQAMQDQWGYPIQMVPMGVVDANLYARQASRDLEFPGYPNGDVIFGPLKDLARQSDIRTMLTGLGGDEWFAGDVYHYADYVRQLKLGWLARQWVADTFQVPGERQLASVIMQSHPLLRYGIWPVLPDGLRKLIRPLVGGREPAGTTLLGPSLRRLPLAPQPGASWREKSQVDFPTLAQKNIAWLLSNPWHIQTIEVMERSSSHSGMELRSPFEDRRIVEFGLALPEEQRWRGRWTKFVLREAMRGHIPELIRTRLTKAEFSHTLILCLIQLEAQGIFENMKTVELGWVDVAAVHVCWRAMMGQYSRGDGEYTDSCWRLWMVAAMELWARAVLVRPLR